MNNQIQFRDCTQISFDPLDHGFDADPVAAHKAAQKARNAHAKALKGEGVKVRSWRLTGQLQKYAGFGIPSGRVRTVYYVTLYNLKAA